MVGFLKARGVIVNQEGYALSEMIQWIWRSAIRNETDEIIVYVPSARMRTLLQAWLEELQNGGHGDEEHIFARASELMKLEKDKAEKKANQKMEKKGKKNSENRKNRNPVDQGEESSGRKKTAVSDTAPAMITLKKK